MKNAIAWLMVMLGTSACDQRPDADRSGAVDRPVTSGVAPSPQHVDSAIPIDEALRRFRRDLPAERTLQGGFGSREMLVREFVRALEVRDTAALRRMVLKTGEFAWLYYPSSPLSRPPYELAPALMWFQLQGESERGASRLFSERGGDALGYIGHTCASPRVEGKNLIHSGCELRRVTAARDTIAERLFGLIIEQDGRYKFVSYANRLD